MINSIEENLTNYVSNLISKGLTKKQIHERLSSVGWKENQIDAAYTKALIQEGIPVPSEAMKKTFGKKSSTIEIALNLFSFILLTTVATATGILFYQIINKYIPDPLGQYFSREAVHYSIASLVVAFPLYYASMYFWFRGFKKDEGKSETGLTRFLTYMLLLISSVLIVGDFITTLFAFLQGEISARFFLKSLVIFFIAATIFSFYFLERRKIQYRKEIPQSIFRIFGITVSVIIFFGIILGFFTGGSPQTARKRAFDNERINDLSSLSSCIENYAQEKKQLPQSLKELENSVSYSYCANKKDPETEKNYSYKIINPSKNTGKTIEGTFELCGNFALDSEKNERGTYYYSSRTVWQDHHAGENCHQITVTLEKLEIKK